MTKFLARFGAISVLAGFAAFSLAADLSIGDKAPAFNPEGWVKGGPMKLESGKTYVIEFWATWCGPCINAMPHLSDMADKYADQVTFVSVNTWDRNEGTEKTAGDKGHVERVAKFVKENASKMRYNIALDDEKDTISTTWMRAAGRNGIPCAFIVNGDGLIAWIGHPMSMDEPLAQLVAGTYDLKAAKERYDAEIAAQKEHAVKAAAAREALVAAAKADDSEGFEAALRNHPSYEQYKNNPGVLVQIAVQGVAAEAPEFALKYMEAKMGDVEIEPSSWCMMLGMVTRAATDQAVKDKAIAMSEDCAGKEKAEMQAIAFAYHARNLGYGGKKEQAKVYIAKARAAVEKFEPAAQRENVSKFIQSVSDEIEKG